MFAEEVGHYWKTSRSGPDVWIARAIKQIEKLGGKVLMEGFGNEPAAGRAAYALAFQIGEDKFRIVWPVLPSKTGNEFAAKVQAATMLHHDVKAKCITAKVLGSRTAFFSYLMLPSGRTTAESTTPELLDAMPRLLEYDGGEDGENIPREVDK